MHILISGQVQGVGFRYATLRMARSLQLGGWVRNLDDGRVEIIAEGSPSDLEQLVEWCHQGPSFAKVDSVQARPAANQGFSDFAIR